MTNHPSRTRRRPIASTDTDRATALRSALFALGTAGGNHTPPNATRAQRAVRAAWEATRTALQEVEA